MTTAEPTSNSGRLLSLSACVAACYAEAKAFMGFFFPSVRVFHRVDMNVIVARLHLQNFHLAILIRGALVRLVLPFDGLSKGTFYIFLKK